MTLEEITVGMEVTYVPRHACGLTSHPDCERGVVTSKNWLYAFVRYGTKMHSQATDPRDLVKG